MDAAEIAAFFAAPADDFNVAFKDAIDFHRQKVNLPTEAWHDIEGRAHDRAFVVAGVTKLDVLAALNKAVDDAIAKGETLEQFRDKLENISAKSGWLADQNEKIRAWRAHIIYEANLRTAYQAGRWKQMRDPDVLRLRPYWRYIHGDLRTPKTPRPDHVALHGLVLLATDPIWRKIYPPNGWFCTCGVQNLSQRELEKLGKTGPDATPVLGTGEEVMPDGTVMPTTNGIDPGWDHAPGADWADGLTPRPDPQAAETAPPATVSQGLLRRAIAAARRFIARFFASADHAEGDTPAAVLFIDKLGEPLAISAAMFRTGENWTMSEATLAVLDAIAQAIIDPDEILLTWSTGPRPAILRHYVRGGIVVTWGGGLWSWSRGATPAGVSAYARDAAGGA
jgi:hypothetical protein